MTTRLGGHLLTGDHASRPAFGDVPDGTLYSCTDHDLIYQSDGSAWSTWATLGGGSGGGQGAWRVTLNEWMAESHVNWNTPAAGFRQSSGAQNDELVFESIALEAGTWNFEGNFYRNPGHGIVTVYLDGASAGTIDLYNGGADSNYYGSVTGIVVASTDIYQLKLKMATKNASASGYYGLVRWPQMRRTA